MSLQIFSDLHLDFGPIKPIKIGRNVTAVIVAGDTCEDALKAFDRLRGIVPLPIPIIMVMGNHEYYRKFLPEALKLAIAKAPAWNIHLLEGSFELEGVRYAGGTFWTDYALFGDHTIPAVMHACARGMNDHRLIGWRKQPWARFRPQEAASLHRQSKARLAQTLATPFEGPTVVVTHHGVGWDAVLPKYKNDLITGAYISNLSDFQKAHPCTLWVHGHVHHSIDYRVSQTRVLCNPHGYGNENPAFDGSLVVEV